jgi:hypothetical protein
VPVETSSNAKSRAISLFRAFVALGFSILLA